MKPMHHIGWLAALATMAVGTAVLAVDLPDPTRPPYAASNAALNGGRAGAVAPAGASGDAAGAATGEASSSRPSGGGGDRAKAVHAAPHGARLSAVMRADAPGRDAAVIDGEVRHVGDKVRGAVLATISASGVTLREAGGRSVRLNLFDRQPESEAASLPLTSPSGAAAPGKEQP